MLAAASYGLNARSLRALELTQAAWRRDRFGVRGKGAAEQPGGLRALIPGELRICIYDMCVYIYIYVYMCVCVSILCMYIQRPAICADRRPIMSQS